MIVIAWMLLILLLLVLSFLLFAPLQLEINSEGDFVRMGWGGLVQGRLVFMPDELLLNLRILFFRKKIYLLRIKKKKTAEPTEKEVEKKKKKRKKKLTWALAKKRFNLFNRVLHSFKIRICKINLDTDDYVTNAYLFPVFYFLDKGKHSFSINYEGKIDVQILIENRGIWVLHALIRQRKSYFSQNKYKLWKFNLNH